jgi:hypothetical protein
MSLFLLLNPKQFGDGAATVIGGGPGGWKRFVVSSKKKKKSKDLKEVLLKYYKGESGTQEQIEVKVRVSFDGIVAALDDYDRATIETERIKMGKKLQRLLKAQETNEALDAARIIEKHIRDKRKKRKRLFEEEEDFIFLSMFEDD